MNRVCVVAGAWAGSFLMTSAVLAQDGAGAQSPPGQPARVLHQARDWMDGVAADVDQNESARAASEQVLAQIDHVARRISFPDFHWLAFALMSAGVVGFALQLVLAKLVVLSKMGFSLKEVLCDALGLAISLCGLVLTTQAAGNSAFTQSPAAVLSATAVGVLAGLLHYLWGQAAEVQALAGRRQLKAAAARQPAKSAPQNQSRTRVTSGK